MIRSDAQTAKAPLLLPPKGKTESRHVEVARRRFLAADAPQRLSVEDLVELRHRLDD